MGSEMLLAMSDTQLIEFADSKLGIPIPVGTPRNTILTKIVNSSVYAGGQ